MDRDRYAEEFARNYHRTAGLLLSRGVPEEEARDVAQAAWVKGWERLHQLQDPGKTLVWVNSIAMNRYRSRYRRESRHQGFEDSPVQPGINLAAIDVQRMLQRLRGVERELLRRRYLEEEPIRDMAQDMECSETALRLRLMRARRSLREKFDEGSPKAFCSKVSRD
ncbi:MAG: sigma-70 family RNA polymerase sigma factor [Acidobacteriota bacterium]